MIYTVTVNPGIDRTLVVPEIEFNQVLRSEKVYLNCGGKGFNVSRVLHQFGVQATTIGFLGGSTGDQIETDLKNAGLLTNIIKISGETRNNIVIIESTSNRYIKVNEPGPMISPDILISLYNEINLNTKEGDYWAFCGSLTPGMNHDFYYQCIQEVQKNGGKACLDTSGSPLHRGCQAGPFLIKPNAEEASKITGIPIKDIDSACQAADRLLEMGAKNIALSLGPDGLIFKNTDHTYQAIPPAINIRNPTGAGDSLLAGLLSGFTAQLSIEETLKWAVAAGTASAMKDDVASASKNEIDLLFSQVMVVHIH